jgi:hypothetical protein
MLLRGVAMISPEIERRSECSQHARLRLSILSAVARVALSAATYRALPRDGPRTAA